MYLKRNGILTFTRDVGRPMARAMAILSLLSTISLSTAILSTVSHAATETPQRVSHALFENVQSHVLDNGLHVISAPRTTSDSVTIQLVVRVGLRDFPCEKQQIPHVLEHVLFENNTRYSPEQLRKKIRDLGGASNGWTNEENTLFSINIHSDYAREALETLLTMVRDIRWDENDILRVKRIVDSEIETPINPIQRMYDSKRSVVEIAKGRLYPGTNLECVKRSEATHLDTGEIRDAYDQYYHADNMSLIMVGNLSESSLAWVRDNFGAIPAKPALTAQRLPFAFGKPPSVHEHLVEKGGYGNAQAWVNLLTRMPGSTDQDFAAAKIVTEYFNEKLYAKVRLKYGLGYTPNAFMWEGSDTSEMIASTKTRSDFYALAETVFRDIYQDLRENQIPDEDLQRLKRKLILNFEAKERDSLDIVSLYRLYRFQIREQGRMPNVIEAIDNVRADDINRVIANYLPPEPMVAVLRPPTPVEAGMAVAGIILAAAVLGWPLNRWIQRRRMLKMQK